MGMNKKYRGYRSYQYLDSRKDYREFKLWQGRDEWKYEIPLSKSEEEKVLEIARESLVISLHDHPIVLPDDISELFEYIREGRVFTGYEELSNSPLDAVFDNLLDGMATITSKAGWKWTDIIHDLGMKLSDIAHQDFIIRGESVEDISTAHKEGKLAIIPTLESATAIENEIDRVDVLYGLGIRMMGLVYSEANQLGGGLKEDRDGGLTDFGHEVVERMNKLGMVIDVSHCGDQTSLDAIEASKDPIFITHCGARALWNIKRLKPDDVIQACGEKGGVIGIEAAPHTTITKNHPEHSIESVMEHFEYCVDLIGIDHVGFGPDTLYGDHVGLHHVFSKHLSIKKAFTVHKEVPYVKGMENPTEAWWNIIRWLVKHGYSDNEIKKVIGGNALRILRRIWG